MKESLQRRLMREGIVQDSKEAAALIMSGRVYVNGQRAVAGQMLKGGDSLMVRGGKEKYLAKGGLKLEAAIQDFGIQVADRICIDAGASTGGFTDCLLKHGAGLVYAVDVGYGQLLGALRQDQRVINLERTNIGDERLHSLSPRPDLGSCDLSYLSLQKAVPLFQAAMQQEAELICLVKPLFEVNNADWRRSGQIPEQAYAPLLSRLIDDMNALPDTAVVGLTFSPVRGNTGTHEFFLHLKLGGAAKPQPIGNDFIKACVDSALQLDAYVKPGLNEL